MGSSSVDAVFGNLDIVMEIYQRLNFINQMQLSRVNVFLQNVFEAYIWNETYTTMNIFEKPHEYIVSNETDLNRLNLKYGELRQLLNCYAHTVERLHLKNMILNPEKLGRMGEVTHGQIVARKQLNLKQFTKLKSLSYHYMAISIRHLKLVADLFPDLEELSMTNCSQGHDIYRLLQEVLPHMKHLKTLGVQDFIRFRLKYNQFLGLLSRRTLETIKFTAALEPDDSLPVEGDKSSLRELHIQATFEPQKWPSNFTSYLKIFESLTILAVEIVEKVTDETLQTIASACKNLTNLDIRFSFFDNVKQFVVPETVRELMLHWCRGLTHDNLQQILNTLPIKKFVSRDTAFEGELTTFYVSPQIESLHVDGVFTQEFQFTDAPNTLLDLTWYHPWSKDGHLVKALTLNACNRLEQFHVNEGHLPLDSLLELRSLQKLIIPHPVPLVTWSYVINLLGHPSLKDLAIRSFCSYRYRYHRMLSEIPNHAIETNLNVLEIPLDVFDVAQGFWLDLYRHNVNLERISCTFYPYERYHLFLEGLVKHPKFPRTQRRIEVCGFSINCDLLRKNSHVYLMKLRKETDNTKCWHDEDVYRIIMKKKY